MKAFLDYSLSLLIGNNVNYYIERDSLKEKFNIICPKKMHISVTTRWLHPIRKVSEFLWQFNPETNREASPINFKIDNFMGISSISFHRLKFRDFPSIESFIKWRFV